MTSTAAQPNTDSELDDERLLGCVLLVGPDGTGKSTLAEELKAKASAAGVRTEHVHWKPFKRPSTKQAPAADPHGMRPRGVLVSTLKVFAAVVEFHLAFALRWRGLRSRGLILIERGWLDMVVDPLRYRLHPGVARFLRIALFLVPKADLVIVLHGSAEVLQARKSELRAAEIVRQMSLWRKYAHRCARNVLFLDTVEGDQRSVLDRSRDGILRRTVEWSAVPFVAKRVALRTAGAHGEWGVYSPQRPGAHARAALGRAAVRAGFGVLVQEPVAGIPDLLRMLNVEWDGLTAIRSSHRGRVVVGVRKGGRQQCVLKVGDLDDLGLRTEASALRRLPPELIPELLWSGEWCRQFVLATAAVEAHGCVTASDIRPFCDELVLGSYECGPMTHGDLAPWNTLKSPTGLVIIDWETCREERAPLHDLAHFVVMEGALLRRQTVRQTCELLIADGGIGWQHLTAVGERPQDARHFVRRYLDEAANPADRRVQAFRTAMRRELSA